ncbi:MAG: FAD:protein FMN transferase [Calditrichia bacterium]
MMKIRISYIAFLWLLAFARPNFCQTGTFYNVKVSKYLMGTIVETDVQGPDISACRKALLLAYQEMSRVENLLSYQISTSEISRINREAGIRPVKVSGETFGIIKRARNYSQKFNGLFDITIGVVTSRWGFSENGEQDITVPSDSELARLLPLVNYRLMVLNERDSTVYLQKKGMKIDLGGIAKGYAIDRGVHVLKQNNISQFFLNAGGDIYTSGKKDGLEKWRVGIKHPRHLDRIIAKFQLSDYAVATSGDYERFAIIGGKRYHHIIDPRSGFPSTQCRSVSVLAPTAEEADAMATWLFILGYNHLKENPEFTLPYFIVDGNGAVHYSQSLAQQDSLEIIPDTEPAAAASQ